MKQRTSPLKEVTIEERLAHILVSLSPDSPDRVLAAHWEQLRTPYSPLTDVSFLTERFAADLTRNRQDHPAAKFAAALGFSLLIPTVGERPDFQSVQVEGEVALAGVARGAIAEVIKPGIRASATGAIVRKAQIQIGL